MFGIQLGTTLGSVELAAEIGFGSYSDKTPGLDPADQNDYSMFLITLLARGDIEDFGGLDWRWIAAFSTGSTELQGRRVFPTTPPPLSAAPSVPSGALRVSGKSLLT